MLTLLFRTPWSSILCPDTFSQVILEIMKRRNQAPNTRTPILIICDEAQVYATAQLFGISMAEIRKLNASLYCASQNTHILEEYAPGIKKHLEQTLQPKYLGCVHEMT